MRLTAATGTRTRDHLNSRPATALGPLRVLRQYSRRHLSPSIAIHVHAIPPLLLPPLRNIVRPCLSCSRRSVIHVHATLPLLLSPLRDICAQFLYFTTRLCRLRCGKRGFRIVWQVFDGVQPLIQFPITKTGSQTIVLL